jgi:FSR family fosmidomycin resistance protein-like MFS transporter
MLSKILVQTVKQLSNIEQTMNLLARETLPWLYYQTGTSEHGRAHEHRYRHWNQVDAVGLNASKRRSTPKAISRPRLYAWDIMVEKGKFRDSGFILVVISHALNHAYEALMPVIYPLLIAEFGLQYSAVGLLVMAYRLTAGAFQLLMGFLGRFYKRKVLLGIGMMWQAATNTVLGFSPSFDQILAARSLAGIGSAPQHPTGSAYITEAFDNKQLGRALGINIGAASLGRFMAPLAASFLIPVIGWRSTLLAFSALGLVVGAGFLLINEPNRPGNWSGASSIRELGRGIRDIFKSRIVVIVMIVETVMAFRVGISDFLPTYFIESLSMSSVSSGLLFTGFLVAGLPAPYFWGYLSDRFERRLVVMAAMGAAAILWFLIPLVRVSSLLLPILLVLGFVGQGVGGVLQAFVAEVTGSENRDIIFGVYFTLAFTIGSISPVIFGVFADAYGFQSAFLYISTVSILAVIAAYFLKE